MSNHVYDDFRRWAPRMNPTLAATIEDMRTYLVPRPSAHVILAHARRFPPSLDAVVNALVVDDRGAVVIHDLKQESGDAVPQVSYRVDGPAGPSGQVVEPIKTPRFHYRLRAHFVVFQSHQYDQVGCMWAEGECYLGDPVRDGEVWRSLIDVDCSMSNVRFSLPGEGRIVTLAAMCAEGGTPIELAFEPIQVEVGTAIGTAIEQLDHVHRGCSLRQGSRGTIVLTE